MLVAPRSDARVIVGVPTYNGVERLNLLLHSVRRYLPDYAQVVALDDGTPGAEGRYRQLAASHPGTALLRHPRNEGITASWNDLSRCTGSDVVVLLNDDIVITDPSWLERMLYFLDNNDCGAASWKTLFCNFEDCENLIFRGGVVPRHPVTREPAPDQARMDADEPPGVLMCPLGCAFAFKRSKFDLVGGFDERMVQLYNESDFGTAFASRGLPSFAIPSPFVWHIWSATFKANPHLGDKGRNDRNAYVAKWGGDFQGPNGTHPRFMSVMPAREVKWLGPDGVARSRVVTIQ